MNRGFTLVELLVCVTIFIIMTALLVNKFGEFNQSTLLTDTAYDVALAVRTAQSYGLSVKNTQPYVTSSNSFSYAYGVSFSTLSSPSISIRCGTSNLWVGQFVLFADTSEPNDTGICSSVSAFNPPLLPDTAITTYALTNGAYINSMCAGQGTSCTNKAVKLDITFQRPNPDMIIHVNGFNSVSYSFAQIVIKGSDGTARTVTLNSTGEISVSQ